jgi:dolichol-phosphate mannosyltransferase
MDQDLNKIIVVIPTYNERENITALVYGILKVLPTVSFLFIDDNSSDGTALKIKELQKEASPNILLLERKTKLGLGSAYIEAFREIIKNKLGKTVVTMDGDLSHPFTALPAMLDLAKQNDLVVGSRYVSGGAIVNWSRSRRLLSKFANLYARAFTRMPIRDLTSGFMVFNSATLTKISLDKIHSDGYSFLIELKYFISGITPKIAEYPIIFTERKSGKSKLSLKVILEAVMLPPEILLKTLMKSSP